MEFYNSFGFYNFEESCLIKKQISEGLLNEISEGRIKLEGAIVEKLERIQSGSYSSMSIERILELGKSHGIKYELLKDSKKDLEEKKEERLRASQRDLEEKEALRKEKMLEDSREFAKENEGEKLHVFLVKKSRMELGGWGDELSNDIEHFIYIAKDSKIKLKKQLEESTEWERGKLKLEKEENKENSFTFTVENDDEPWEVYTYTLVNQIELNISILMEIFGKRDLFLGFIKNLISGKSSIIELDIEDSQKNALFFDPSKLSKELSIKLKDLNAHQFNSLVEDLKKVLGFFPTK